MTAAPPDKKQTLLHFMGRGVAMIHLDARRPGVVVPKQFEGEAHLRLNLSYRYNIPDLVIDDAHVQATLSFGGRPFQCKLPWPSVFGITSHTSGDGQVWPEDLPTEVMHTLATRPGSEAETSPDAAEESREGAAAAPEPAPRSGRPSLVPVEGAAEARREPDPGEAPKAPAPRHLRLVR